MSIIGIKTALKNQGAKYLLINWHRYDQLSGKLDAINQTNMKSLYIGLSSLTSNERKFLADKYHYQDGKKIDKEMAPLYGLTTKEYSKERIRIETKLQEVIAPLLDKLHEETNFSPYTIKTIVQRDGKREDIITGLPFLEKKHLPK